MLGKCSRLVIHEGHACGLCLSLQCLSMHSFSLSSWAFRMRPRSSELACVDSSVYCSLIASTEQLAFTQLNLPKNGTDNFTSSLKDAPASLLIEQISHLLVNSRLRTTRARYCAGRWHKLKGRRWQWICGKKILRRQDPYLCRLVRYKNSLSPTVMVKHCFKN